MSDELETIKESAKAAQEIAKTTGQVVGAGQKLGQFLAKFIEGPLEQASGIVEDRLKYMRWERQLRLMKRADDFMKEMGILSPTRAVPIKFAIPLIQSASLEDDDDLQDLFAKLLVNAASKESGVNIKRIYIDIIERISPLEAQILNTIYSLPYEDTKHKSLLTKDLPRRTDIVPDDPKFERENPSLEVQLALANLAFLGCISIGKSWGGGQLMGSVNQTFLGKKFVEACTLKKPIDE